MPILPNSLSARDAAVLVHPQTNIRAHLKKGAQIISGSNGSRIYDETGKDFIECLAGLWCCPLGFKSERLAKVAYEQMANLGFYHIYKHHSHESAVKLAEKVMGTQPIPMARVIFQGSGSEANEAALKLCWFYNNALGRPERKKIIGRKGGFHGHTSGAASISGKPDTHNGFGLPLERFIHTEFPHYYKRHEEGETEEQFADRMAEALENLILAEGPETIAGFFAEPIMGASGGVLPPKTYFAKIQAVLRKYDILFVADEVITGIGRTGNWWATTTFDLQPDIITSAKGLGSGLIPISAVMISQKVFDAMAELSDRINVYAHGSTFSGHPVATAVAHESLTIIEEEGLIAHGAEIGNFFLRELADLRDHDMIGDFRGVGALISMEIVADRTTRAGFPAAANVNGILARHCSAEGVLPRLGGDRVVFAPPLVMTFDEAGEAVKRFRRALDATRKEVRAL
jgi:4-aminobutyrate--pyruvate transaminase